MDIDAIFKLRRKKWDMLIKSRKAGSVSLQTCKYCKSEHTKADLADNYWICPDCGSYLAVSPKNRIQMLADPDTFHEMYSSLQTKDPLEFPEYASKITANKEKTGNADAIITGTCDIRSIKTAIGVFDPSFLMGSMGTVVGEKIFRLTEYARKKHLPLILISASGGARMQEGLFSLMQMAKTSAVIQKFKDEGGLFLSFLTDPTTGGVSASFASLGDIIIAEPGALICFAGPRVIEQTIGQTLPEGFQRAEFLEEHGMIDMILERKEQRKTIACILKLHLRQSAATKKL